MVEEQLDAFLAHHGVKGMRWGVRRDRDSGGSSKPREKKKVSELSNAELQRRVKRLQMEKQFKDLQKPSRVDPNNFRDAVLKKSMYSIAGTAITGLGGIAVTYMLKKSTPAFESSADKAIEAVLKQLQKGK